MTQASTRELTVEPLVSVVTPVYNSHHHIEQTWESIREQTMTQWEWVIVDDGSTDFPIARAVVAVRPVRRALWRALRR